MSTDHNELRRQREKALGERCHSAIAAAQRGDRVEFSRLWKQLTPDERLNIESAACMMAIVSQSKS